MSRQHSLRSRVAIAAALGATIIVTLVGFAVSHELEVDNVRQMDERLKSTSTLVLLNADIAVQVLNRYGSDTQLALTVRSGGRVRTSTPVQLPNLQDGFATVNAGGQQFRALTITSHGQQVSLAQPRADATANTRRQQRWVLLASLLTICATAGLGWIFGGRAIRPIVLLSRLISERPPGPVPRDTGVREATELADAVNMMLAQVTAAQEETAAALETARDFASASAHELRTPLTAMRTDIEVLRTLDLDAGQRDEILSDLQRAQSRVESTLAALERLATGELASDKDFTEFDLVELCDLAAHEARRHSPNMNVTIDSAPTLVMRGFSAGLRLTLDNAIRNAERHGKATHVVITAMRTAQGRIQLLVDDDGIGIPVAEREMVFERFHRGSTAGGPGSGLGLALVAQQAQLHGGTATISTSPLGGARLSMEFPDNRV